MLCSPIWFSFSMQLLVVWDWVVDFFWFLSDILFWTVSVIMTCFWITWIAIFTGLVSKMVPGKSARKRRREKVTGKSARKKYQEKVPKTQPRLFNRDQRANLRSWVASITAALSRLHTRRHYSWAALLQRQLMRSMSARRALPPRTEGGSAASQPPPTSPLLL